MLKRSLRPGYWHEITRESQDCSLWFYDSIGNATFPTSDLFSVTWDPPNKTKYSCKCCTLCINANSLAKLIFWARGFYMALLAMWHFIKTLGHVAAEGSDLPSLSMPTCSHHSSWDGFQLELPACQSARTPGNVLLLSVWSSLWKKKCSSEEDHSSSMKWQPTFIIFHEDLNWFLERNIRRLWWSTVIVSMILLSAGDSESLLIFSESD